MESTEITEKASKLEIVKTTFRTFRTPVLVAVAVTAGLVLYARVAQANPGDLVPEINPV